MAGHNTAFDAANTAVRAFLTKIGEYYLGRNFNTGSGKAKADWEKIRDKVFEGKCAYCGTSETKLQADHLVMFNKEQFGLHHPGNIVPSCPKCNSRSKHSSGNYNSWEDHLSFICKQNKELDKFHERWEKIKKPPQYRLIYRCKCGHELLIIGKSKSDALRKVPISKK